MRTLLYSGGSWRGIAYNIIELRTLSARDSISTAGEVLVEESVCVERDRDGGVRDKNGNGIIICSIENFDAMARHTRDAITVARLLLSPISSINASGSLAGHHGEGGIRDWRSNVQFAVNQRWSAGSHRDESAVFHDHPHWQQGNRFPDLPKLLPAGCEVTRSTRSPTISPRPLPHVLSRYDYVVVRCHVSPSRMFKGTDTTLTTR
jgi:carbamoyl-phosphate synthase large subunit